MRTKQIDRSVYDQPGFGAGSGDTERYVYECPCGQGRIVEEHDNIPGFRSHDVWIDCPVCSKKYRLDISLGVRAWDLVEKTEVKS